MWYYVQQGQQVGPVSKEDLQGFIECQSLPAGTMVWRDGMVNWLPAYQIPELMDGLPAVPVPQPAPGMPYMQPPPNNTMALVSMILGLLGLFVAWIFTAIPAVICGHMARRQIRESNGLQTGDGMALTGLITGYLVIILTLVFGIFLVIFFFFVMDAVTEHAGSLPPSSSPRPSPIPSLPTPAPPPVTP